MQFAPAEISLNDPIIVTDFVGRPLGQQLAEIEYRQVIA